MLFGEVQILSRAVGEDVDPGLETGHDAEGHAAAAAALIPDGCGPVDAVHVAPVPALRKLRLGAFGHPIRSLGRLQTGKVQSAEPPLFLGAEPEDGIVGRRPAGVLLRDGLPNGL